MKAEKEEIPEREYLFRVMFEDGAVFYWRTDARGIREARKKFAEWNKHLDPGWCLVGVYGQI